MICFFCLRRITGSDVYHRHEWRRQEDGSVNVYGEDSGRPLRDAVGQLVKLSHKKCYHADKKQQELKAARDADASAQLPGDSDWRHQEVVEVGELSGEGDRGDRGA